MIVSAVRRCAFMLAVVFVTASLRADIRLPAIFSDHMVLDRSAPVPIWGKATPGEDVTITLGGQSVTTTTDHRGHWRADLDLQDFPPGPFEMTVAGRNVITISDVVVGEVWLASGQSNMQWPLERTGAKEEIAQSTNAFIRHFKIERSAQPGPTGRYVGAWTVAGPESAGSFSSIGYYFSKTLQSELQVPVGIVDANWGGAPLESWISEETIDSSPELKASRERFLELFEAPSTQKDAFVKAFGKWLAENHREDPAPSEPVRFAAESIDLAGWSPVELPGTPAASPGVFWLRHQFDLLPGLAGKKTFVNLGLFDGYESIFLNGQPLLPSTYQTLAGAGVNRVVPVPEGTTRERGNVLAVRVFAPVQPVEFSAIPQLGPIVLEGPWLVRSEHKFPDLSPARLAAVPAMPTKAPAAFEMASFLFNGMIHPVIPYAISGVIWYQGESNVGRAWQYRTTFPLLIKDWRSQWKQAGLPFYFCQLPNYLPKETEPTESAWAELREAQSKALQLPHTGQVVLIDLGESLNVHPQNKKDAGERLTRVVLAKEYGKTHPHSGPVLRSSVVEGGRMRVLFDHVEGGLAAGQLPATYNVDAIAGETAPLLRNSPRSELEGFAICGEDRKWVWADAKIEGDTVLVWSDHVPAPIAVRYAWANNPTCNLINGAGLPASPFRTDDFPALTKDARY